MNKLLRISMMAILAMLFNVSFADEATFTFNTEDGVKALGLEVPKAGEGTKVETVKSGDVTLTATTATGKTDTRIFQSTKNVLDFRIYTDGTLTFTAGNNYITEITFDGKSLNKLNVEGGYNDGVWKGSEQSVTFTAAATVNINTITVKYQSTPAVTKKAANIEFDAEKDTATLGSSYTIPTLAKETNAAVKYTSTNEKVATIDASTGAITLVAVGTTTIKAEVEENDEYYGGEASYQLVVVAPVRDVVTLPYEEAFATGIGSFTTEDVALDSITYVWNHDAKNKYMKASAYANKKNYASESWLVSPTIDLKNEKAAYLNFSHCISKFFGTVSEEATLWVKEVNGEWEQIAIEYPELKEGSNWSSFMDIADIDLSKYAGKEIKIGFKYVSTADHAGTWEIKNVSVNNATTAGVNAITLEKTNTPLYNLAGQRVSNGFKGIVVKNGKKYINRK